MESDIAQTGQMYSLLGWLEKNRKQIISTAIILTIIGIVIAFVLWRKEQKEIAAGEALSAMMVDAGQTGASAEALLKLASEHAGTEAAARAQLAAAGQLFADGKIADSQAAFEKFVADSEGNLLVAQARLGIAACLDAEGKSAEAIAAFKAVADRYPGENTVTPAKFSLAGLYEKEGKLEMARDIYMELARESRTIYGSEAIGRLTQMFQAHPELQPGAAAAAPTAAAALPVQ